MTLYHNVQQNAAYRDAACRADALCTGVCPDKEIWFAAHPLVSGGEPFEGVFVDIPSDVWDWLGLDDYRIEGDGLDETQGGPTRVYCFPAFILGLFQRRDHVRRWWPREDSELVKT